MKRFYRDAAVAEGGMIALDGKMLKTPRGATLVVPTPALAEAIADEWRAQGDTIVPATLALTKLANTAIDGVTRRRSEVVAEILAFARHDHLCYRADTPPELVRRQSEAWDPLLDWAARRYGARLAIGAGIASMEQPGDALDALRRAVEPLDPFVLTTLHVAASICGSLVLALALAEKRIDATEAFALSQLDERYQAETWGIDAEAESRVRRLASELCSAARFVELART